MRNLTLNYDLIASENNQRYPHSQQWECGQALLGLARQLHAQNILEVVVQAIGSICCIKFQRTYLGLIIHRHWKVETERATMGINVRKAAKFILL